jgi:hypothetical protein
MWADVRKFRSSQRLHIGSAHSPGAASVVSPTLSGAGGDIVG